MSMKTNKTMPADYPVCLLSDCPKAATCLHQIAFSTLQKSEPVMQLLNPRKCTKGNRCKHYRDSKQVTYAIGFTNFQKRMYPEQYQTFMRLLIKKFGRNAYFERRRGMIPLPPKEQEVIIAALRKAGVTEDLPFDHYESRVNYWD